MGTTTNLALPYPEPSDLVKDGATAMASLATTIDTAHVDEHAIIEAAAGGVTLPAANSVIDLQGARDLAGFTWSAGVLTYAGPSPRPFIVTASVSTQRAVSTAVEAFQSTATLQHTTTSGPTTIATSGNGMDFGTHTDVETWNHSHGLTGVTILAPGDELRVLLTASPATSMAADLRALPLGPARA